MCGKILRGFLFQEILAHWGECVDENTSFQADASMRQIGCNVIAIASVDDFLFVADSDLEASAGHVCTLGMRVLMKSADGSLLELHFNHHQVFIVCHNLTDYAFTGILPLDVGGNLKSVVFCFHNQNFSVNSSIMSWLSTS